MYLLPDKRIGVTLARWKPPHQDPTRAQNPVGSRHVRCVWSRCQTQRQLWYDVPLCSHHVDQVLRAERRLVEQRAAKEQAAIDSATADVEAGIMLNDDEPIPGWIYYLRLDGIIKIGFTKSLRRRVKEYGPTATLLATEPGTRKVERQRHQYFGKHLAVGREWFTESEDLAEWIDELVEVYGPPDPTIGRFTKPTDAATRAPEIVGGKHLRNTRW